MILFSTGKKKINGFVIPRVDTGIDVDKSMSSSITYMVVGLLGSIDCLETDFTGKLVALTIVFGPS